MSGRPFIARLLPSQRVRLAWLYREIAVAYRAGFEDPANECAAKIADLMAGPFEEEVDAPLSSEVTGAPLNGR